MDPLIILLLAILVVIGGVLWLRLHAFVALFAASLVVACLTPAAAVYDTELRSHGARIVSIDEGAHRVRLRPARGQAVLIGTVHVFRESGSAAMLRRVGSARLQTLSADDPAVVSVCETALSTSHICPYASES